jgi:hypothetical protein
MFASTEKYFRFSGRVSKLYVDIIVFNFWVVFCRMSSVFTKRACVDNHLSSRKIHCYLLLSLADSRVNINIKKILATYGLLILLPDE